MCGTCEPPMAKHTHTKQNKKYVVVGEVAVALLAMANRLWVADCFSVYRDSLEGTTEDNDNTLNVRNVLANTQTV